MIGDCQGWTKGLWASVVSFGLCACTGVVVTPEPDPVASRGGAIGTAGRGGTGSASASGSAGAGARGSADAGGSGGAGGSASSTEGGSSGSGEPDAGGVVTPDPDRQYCDAVSLVFRPTCGNGSCHTNPGATIGDFGAGPEQAAAYVGRGSVRDADCGLIIDPIEPQQSLILTKVTGDYPSDQNCGGSMPVGSFEITDEQIDCISDWVEQFRD